MIKFKNKLEELAKQCQQNFEASVSSNHGEHDDKYVRIRSDVLELYAKAQKQLLSKELAVFKSSVIDFLCANSGCSLDIEMLDNYTPHVLSEKDYDHIIQNSALARWL